MFSQDGKRDRREKGDAAFSFLCFVRALAKKKKKILRSVGNMELKGQISKMQAFL